MHSKRSSSIVPRVVIEVSLARAVLACERDRTVHVVRAVTALRGVDLAKNRRAVIAEPARAHHAEAQVQLHAIVNIKRVDIEAVAQPIGREVLDREDVVQQVAVRAVVQVFVVVCGRGIEGGQN